MWYVACKFIVSLPYPFIFPFPTLITLICNCSSLSYDQTSIVFFCCFTGLPLTEAELHEAAIQSGVLDTDDAFLDDLFRKECERIIPHPEELYYVTQLILSLLYL